MAKLPNCNETVRRLNPHIFGGAGKIQAGQSKPTTARSLVKRLGGRKKGQESLVARITFISLRRRLLDPDNLALSTKHLQDAVCETIGIDDGDPRLDFEYRQQLTHGEELVIVKLEL